MDNSATEEIKERLPLAEVASSYLKLERSGKNFRARCPFHNEKTPSFFISPERNTYYCFGCGAKGDIFSLVQAMEGLDFVGALKTLAERAGIDLRKFKLSSSFSSSSKVDPGIYSVLEAGTKFFERKLTENVEALEYLKKRGISDLSIKIWRIGYASSDWRELKNHLNGNGFNDEIIQEAGLILSNQESKTSYDRFRSRIMFPIFDASSRVIAFSGRIFPDDPESAKYVNSPETSVFNKSSVLYGFNRAKNGIHKFGFVLLVEGQMDVIMSHQAGFINTLASSGTSLTEKQLSLIKRMSPKLLIAFDADKAGFSASKRAWQMALKEGMEIRVADLKGGKDPADLVKEDPQLLKESIKNSKTVIDFLIEKMIKKDLPAYKKAVIASNEILPYIAMINKKTIASHFVKNLSHASGISEDVLWSDLSKIEQKNESEEKFQDKKIEMGIDRIALGVFWLLSSKDPILAESFFEQLTRVYGDSIKKIQSDLEKEKEEILFFVESFYSSGISDQEVKSVLKKIEINNLKKQRDQLNQVLSQQGLEENQENALLTEIQAITQKINELQK